MTNLLTNSILSVPFSLETLLVCLGTACVLGVLTALVFSYRSHSSESFCLALAILPVAVAVVIMMVNGNVGTGVAVAGAFALVRFRSMPGTAKEIAAIFTTMTLGLALGMGYVGIAILFFVIMAVFTLFLTAIGFGAKRNQPHYLRITIPEDLDYEGLFDELFAKYTKMASLVSVHTTNMGTLFELSYEVVFNTPQIPKDFIDGIRVLNGNLKVAVENHPGKELAASL